MLIYVMVGLLGAALVFVLAFVGVDSYLAVTGGDTLSHEIRLWRDEHWLHFAALAAAMGTLFATSLFLVLHLLADLI